MSPRSAPGLLLGCGDCLPYHHPAFRAAVCTVVVIVVLVTVIYTFVFAFFRRWLGVGARASGAGGFPILCAPPKRHFPEMKEAPAAGGRATGARRVKNRNDS